MRWAGKGGSGEVAVGAGTHGVGRCRCSDCDGGQTGTARRQSAAEDPLPHVRPGVSADGLVIGNKFTIASLHHALGALTGLRSWLGRGRPAIESGRERIEDGRERIEDGREERGMHAARERGGRLIYAILTMVPSPVPHKKTILLVIYGSVNMQGQ